MFCPNINNYAFFDQMTLPYHTRNTPLSHSLCIVAPHLHPFHCQCTLAIVSHLMHIFFLVVHNLLRTSHVHVSCALNRSENPEFFHVSTLSANSAYKWRYRGLGPSRTWSVLPVREVSPYQRVESMLYLRTSILALKWRWLGTCQDWQ